MFPLRETARILILSLAIAALPLSGCSRTLSIPVSASQMDRELTDCHAIQAELRELEPLVRDPFEHNQDPLNFLAIVAAGAAAAGGIFWAFAKNEDPFFPPDSSAGQQERGEIGDDKQFWKGMTYSSLAALAAFLGLNWALSDASERSKNEQIALQKRMSALQQMRAENDCVDYGAQ